jgi:dTDP-4-amino-4,6-dideoxygalactose transaminase
MYIPPYPGLDPAILFQRGDAEVPFPLNAAHATYFFRARNAIYHLFRHLGLGPDAPVLVPSYHSGSEIEAIRAAGASLRFYSINRRLEPDLDEIAHLCRREPRPRVLFAIHFLGWPQPIEALAALCRENDLILVEDCALAMLSERRGRPLGSFGNYAVFCLYKTVPVPNGGLLVQNRDVIGALERLKLGRGGLISVTGRICDLLLERSHNGSNHFRGAAMVFKRGIGKGLSALNVARTPVGDMGFDINSVDLAISGLSQRLLQRFNYDEVRRKRRENFLALQSRLAGKATFVEKPLQDGICPLFFPLLVADKSSAAAALRDRGIGALEFWNTSPARTDADDVAFLRQHVLELPIHQDVTPEQVSYMAEQVLNLGLGWNWPRCNAA